MRAGAAQGRRRERRRFHARARAMSEGHPASPAPSPIAEPEPFVVEMIPRMPRGVALDVAAGRGRNALAMARAGIRVVAVDWSHPAMKALGAAARSERLAVWPVV